MQKILFLDFDGVLNASDHIARLRRSGNPLSDRFGYRFDPQSVARLKRIIERTEGAIVISSSWKLEGLARMREMWRERQMPGQLLDITPSYAECMDSIDPGNSDSFVGKGHEIRSWLRRSSQPGCRYAILDDEPDILAAQRPYFVRTDPQYVITEEDALRVIAILNNESEK